MQAVALVNVEIRAMRPDVRGKPRAKSEIERESEYFFASTRDVTRKIR